MALVYQTSMETGAGSGVKIILRQSPREIHKHAFLASFRALINAVAGNNCHLKTVPPFIHGQAYLESSFYDMQVHNTANI